MGLIKRFFKNVNSQVRDYKKDTSKHYPVLKRSSVPEKEMNFVVHEDLSDLLWLGDGPRKNYVQSNTRERINIDGYILEISYSGNEEPSAIYLNLPVDLNGTNVDRLPYYPNYKDLTPGQRGMYWKFLKNPYTNQYEIGYAFILYYGLERHLLNGKYEKAMKVVMKMRKVHKNSSFQYYSANAIILSCLRYQRADLLMELMESMEDEYSKSISPNLLLLCKYGLRLPLRAKEIMGLAKTFEYNKTNYIKKYPDLFCECLCRNMEKEFGKTEILCSYYINDKDFRKLPTEQMKIFTNTSLDLKQEIPLLIHSFPLKKGMYELLNATHEDVKAALANMRKAGTTPKPVEGKKKDKEELSFDKSREKMLLTAYNKAKSGTLDQHFASIELQNFYYK